MRQLEREKRTVWVAPFESKRQREDENGRLTGVWDVLYGKPVKHRPTLSPCAGNVISDGFGLGNDYDRTMIIADTGLGIDEASVAWVDCEPVLDRNGYFDLLRPSCDVQPFTYRSADPALFSAVVKRQLPPGPGPFVGRAGPGVRPVGCE